MTNLEQMTFDNLQKVIKLYGEAKTDSDKLYHLVNGISLLRTLQTFINTKMEVTAAGQGEAKATNAKDKSPSPQAIANAETTVNVNIDSKDKK